MTAIDSAVSFAGLPGSDLLIAFSLLLFIETPRYLIVGAAAALVSQFRHLDVPDSRRASRKPPTLSVILPCHNGHGALLKTVRSLREQTLPQIQIVVVDDGSTDDTAAVGTRLKNSGMIDVFLSTGLRGGKSSALNLGLLHCGGDIVVSADVDTTFDRDSMYEIQQTFLGRPELGAAGGNVAVRNAESSLLATMQAIEYRIGITLGRQIGAILGIVTIASGAFAAFRREALLAVGGWEAGPGEDADVTLKIREAGWQIDFVAAASALTDVPSTIFGLMRQRSRWDTDLVRVFLQKFRSLGSPFRGGFSLLSTASWIDVLFFGLCLPVISIVWVCWVVASWGATALPLLLFILCLYTTQGVLLFGLSLLVDRRNTGLRLLPFTVLYGFYQAAFINPLRVWALLDELLLGRSYRSEFVPTKVLNRIERF